MFPSNSFRQILAFRLASTENHNSFRPAVSYFVDLWSAYEYLTVFLKKLVADKIVVFILNW